MKTGTYLAQIKDTEMTKEQNELRCESCVFDCDGGKMCDECEDFCYWVIGETGHEVCKGCSHYPLSNVCMYCINCV